MLCPNCATDNIQGVDACEACGTELAGLDLPAAGGGFAGRLLTGRVKDLPISEAVMVSTSETVRSTVERMRAASSGCVFVESGGEVVGLFNERHLLTRVLRRGKDLDTTPVSQVMSLWPLKLSPEDPPAFAIHCMVTYRYRHLPVVSEGKIQGYISVRNILAYLRDEVLSEGDLSNREA